MLDLAINRLRKDLRGLEGLSFGLSPSGFNCSISNECESTGRKENGDRNERQQITAYRMQQGLNAPVRLSRLLKAVLALVNSDLD